MFAFLTQGSPLALGFLSACLILVLLFEISNGFHDSANAVATVIYTHSLKPVYAVVWSGIMNFLGVILGGIAVAYALVELIPPDVLSPPSGGHAVGLLAACGNLVVRSPEFEFARHHWLAHRHRGRELTRSRARAQQRRRLASGVERAGIVARLSHPWLRTVYAPLQTREAHRAR